MKLLPFSHICAISAVALIVGVAAAQFGPGSEPSKNPAKKADKPAAQAAPSAPASPAKVENSAADFCQCTEGKSEAAVRIERALASPLRSAGLDYSEAPLKEVADQLSNDYNVPIQLDRIALDEAGVPADSPVTVSLHNISLRSALRLMSKTLGITFVIQDEVLLITTKEAAEQRPQICVYDARKVLTDASDKNVQSLVQTIEACVDGDTWKENGGGAQIRQLPGGLIVVAQTQEVHQNIHDLLATIQRMNRK